MGTADVGRAFQARRRGWRHRGPDQPPLKLRRSAEALAKAERAALLVLAFSVSLAAAGPDVPSPDGTTALHRAISINDVQKAEALVRAGADVNAVNRYGVTPLALAAGNGNAALLARLFVSGADAKA